MRSTTRFIQAFVAALVILFQAVFLPARSSSSEEIVWQQTTGPYGAWINALAVTPSYIFAATEGAGVFRSMDKGDARFIFSHFKGEHLRVTVQTLRFPHS